MDKPSPALRDLARRLLAHEAASQTAPDPSAPEAVRLIQTLRKSLTQLAGADGFTALLRRALALARAEAPALEGVQLTADSHLEGLETAGTEAGVALTAHLLGLLVTLVGQAFTLHLVREVWPKAPLDK